MTGIIFDLLYVFPIYLVSLFGTDVLLDDFSMGSIELLISAFLMVMVAVVYNSKSRLKYLIPGALFVVCFGVVMVKPKEIRSEFLLESRWMLWALIAAVVILIVGRISAGNRWIRRFIALSIVVSLILLMCFSVDINKMLVPLAFMQLLVYLADEIQIGWVKSGYTDRKKHLVYTAPFVAIICITVYLVPVKDYPYDWHFAVKTFNRIVDAAKTATKYFAGEGDDYARVGFSERAVMTGVIQQYPKELMEVTETASMGNILYLSGKSFEKYNGRGWEAENMELSHERIIDTIETECAVKRFDPEYTYNYLKASKVDITYQLFNTNYLFAPPKAIIYSNEITSVKYKEQQDALLATERIGYGTKYTVRFYRLNKNTREFADLVNDSHDITREEWENSCLKYNHGNLEGCSYEEYIQYKENVKELYTEDIPISEELRAKLDEVYEGVTSPWDKMKKLESWIGSFTYTTRPGKIPEHVQSASEFLDYFLLEKKEGYCVHFATAFTLLARAEGLPARFVQGCYVNKANRSTLLVTADNAHAWPEVYFENIGWVPFEPTPDYNRDRYWMEGSGIESYGSYKGSEESDIQHNNEKAGAELPVEEAGEETDVILKKVLAAIIPLSLGLVFICLCLYIYRLITLNRMSKMSSTQMAILRCRCNIMILRMLGYDIKDGQTLTEYAGLVREDMGEDAVLFIPYLEEMIYAGREAKECGFEATEHSKAAIYEYMKACKKHRMLFYYIRISLRFTALVYSNNLQE